jgi:hypothetical protein
MRRYTRPMRRAMPSVAAVSTALVVPLVSGASPHRANGEPVARRDVSGHITLRLRYKTGPWATRLPVKLIKERLETFKVCGVWNWPPDRRFTCLGAGSRLPERTVMRMEQTPIAKALRRDDSPGWGMVGLSTDPVIRAPLSNTETGNKYGTFYYRVTLRDLDGKVLLASNKVAIVWHR